MNFHHKIFLCLFLLAPLTELNSTDRSFQEVNYKLNLRDSGKKIENIISFNTSRSDFEALKSTEGTKVKIKALMLVINGDTLEPEGVSTRGQSSLSLRRKSYTFRLKSEANFRHGEISRPFKKFLLISLSMDKYYCHNRMAFEMMSRIKIFDLFYTFCELRINGRSEGICMVIERPQDWEADNNSPFMIRRGYDHSIEKMIPEKGIPASEIRYYTNNFRQIYRFLNKYKGEELYKNLCSVLDLDSYMKWMAFNLFVRNGDYSDEVFFYIDPDTRKFSVIPWDYDDLFSRVPHESASGGVKFSNKDLVYSKEDQLDKKIATDLFLYKIYLNHLREMLEQLTPEAIKNILETTFSELYPYYSQKEIIDMSLYDVYKDASMENLRRDMGSICLQLLSSREYYLKSVQIQTQESQDSTKGMSCNW